MAVTEKKVLSGTGRRKSSSAVVRIKEGKGKITINNRDFSEYVPMSYQREEVEKPLKVTDMQGRFDITVKVGGGGVTGQIDAIQLGIARSLVKLDPSLTGKLREFGLLTRDPRMKERKKYGQKGARKKFQWTKR